MRRSGSDCGPDGTNDLARKDNGDIPAAVRALGVALSPREVVIQRANPALARLDPRLAQAKANGATAAIIYNSAGTPFSLAKRA